MECTKLDCGEKEEGEEQELQTTLLSPVSLCTAGTLEAPTGLLWEGVTTQVVEGHRQVPSTLRAGSPARQSKRKKSWIQIPPLFLPSSVNSSKLLSSMRVEVLMCKMWLLATQPGRVVGRVI